MHPRMSGGVLIEFITANLRQIAFAFTVLFGVVAGECYQALKNEQVNLKLILPKYIVALLVCILIRAWAESYKSLKDYTLHVVMVFAAIHRQCADWIFKDLFKTILKTWGYKKDNE